MAACIPVHRAFCHELRGKLLAEFRSYSSKNRSAMSTSKNGSGGSTTLTGGSNTLTSRNFRSVMDKLSQHRRKASDGESIDEPGCLSLPSAGGGGGCHGATTDDNASDRAILPVHVNDMENRDTSRSGSEVAVAAAPRNSGKILMTQEVKIEYHPHPDLEEGGRRVLDEREQTPGQYGHELEDMGRPRNP